MVCFIDYCQFLVQVNFIEISFVLLVPLLAFFGMPLRLAILGTTCLLSVTNTRIRRKPLTTYSARPFIAFPRHCFSPFRKKR